MLGNLVIVRLKAAENAARDGRVDEAYRLATSADLRDHLRAKAVLKSISERFIERAKAHLAGGRYSAALADLDRAEAAGVGLDEIEDLRRNIRTVADEEIRNERSRRERLDQAKKRIEAGSLNAGKNLLEQASLDDLDACKLKGNAERRADEVEQILDQVEALLEDSQVAAAVDRLLRAKALHPQATRLPGLESRVCQQVLDQAHGSLVEGRIERAGHELAILGSLGAALPQRKELETALETVRVAAGALHAIECDSLGRHVRRLAHTLPSAQWVQEALRQVTGLDEHLGHLHAGPLGAMMNVATRTTDAVAAAAPRDLAETIAVPRMPASGPLPDKLLLLVDGAGSFLLLRCDSVSIGRANSDRPADIPLISSLSERHAQITRMDDDYFVFAERGVQIGPQSYRQKLLEDADRLELNRQARMTFRLPNRASSSAVLELGDSVRMPNAVTRVVLFKNNVVIGSRSNAHLRVIHAGRDLVLFEKSGQLWIRGTPGDREAKPVSLGVPMEVDGISLVVKTWTLPAGQGTVT